MVDNDTPQTFCSLVTGAAEVAFHLKASVARVCEIIYDDRRDPGSRRVGTASIALSGVVDNVALALPVGSSSMIISNLASS
jgi:hypothetical protein